MALTLDQKRAYKANSLRGIRTPCRGCGGSMNGKHVAARYCSEQCKVDIQSKPNYIPSTRPEKECPIDPKWLVRGDISNHIRCDSIGLDA